VLVLHRGSVVWDGAAGDLPLDSATLESWGLLPPDPAVSSRDSGGAAPRAKGEHSIVFSDLHFSYAPLTAAERPVLRGIDLDARPGEIIGIIGAIGSGKTTLVQHLNGLLLPQRGRVRVGGGTLEPGTKLSRLLSGEMGVVFQFPEKQLFAETDAEDVAAGLEFAEVDEALIPARVRAALERVGLDPVGRRRIGALLGDLAHRAGKTVVVVSHHLADLFRIADRVAVLHEGRIAFCGTSSELLVSGDLERWGIL
jgi:energy-coupling factor transport system ATP-binding protein